MSLPTRFSLSLAALATMALFVAGCGNSFDCTFQGKCADDVPLTGDNLTRCQTEIADPVCGDPLSSLGNCLLSHETCDASGNQDQEATMAPCAAKQDAYDACCTAHPDSDACPRPVP